MSRSSSRGGRRRVPAYEGFEPKRRRLPRWLRRTLLGLGVLIIVGLVGCGVLLARDVSAAKTALSDATSQAKTLQDQLTDGDNAGARNTLRGLQRTTGSAVSHTDGPLWDVSAHLPFVGDSVDAVQTATTSVNDIAVRGLPPIVSSSRAIDADLFKPTDGRFDLKAFASLAAPVSTASDVLTENRKRIDAIDQSSLLSAVREPVAELKSKIATAQKGAHAADLALRLAPGMLGANGNRTYLLLFQNNAEARTTGGIPGAAALVQARGGKLSFDDSVSRDDIKIFAKPVLRLTKDEKNTVGTTIGTDLRDVNLTPDFPRSAQLARTMAERSLNRRIDGVVSVDPVALSYALEGTGAVRVAGGTTLTASNAVDVLLNEVYSRYSDPKAQDAFFATSAARIFTQVLDGRGDSRKVLEGLSQGADEHRIMLWSATRAEQRLIAPTLAAGALDRVEGAPELGVYVNDATASKMQYYLRQTASVKATQCTDDGRQTLRLSTTLRSIAPADASLLPKYIVGNGKYSREGTQRLGVQLALPKGAKATRLLVNGKQQVMATSTLDGRLFVRTAFVLKPGQRITVSIDLRSGSGQTGRPVLDQTPGVVSLDNGRRFPSACS